MTRPHVVIMATGGPGWLGGRQYAVNLVRAILAYRERRDDFDLSVLVRGADEVQHFAPMAAELKTLADVEPMLDGGGLGGRVARRLKRASGWVNPRFEEPLARMGATFAYPFSSAIVPSADWISDFQYHHHPDRMSAAEIRDREAEFSAIVRQAQTIVLSSHDAEKDCHAIFPQSKGRTFVLQFRTFADEAWLAADTGAVLAKYNIPQRYCLISNWLLPTKNHGAALKALSLMSPAARKKAHLVCTGDLYDYRNPGFYNGFLQDIATLGLRDQVSVLGVIPKSDQIQLLRGAAFYLQPSLFEGWNTGVEEARMLGRPMVVSDIPVHREQAPPRSVFFDPHDPAALAKLLETAFADHSHDPTPEHEAASLTAYRDLQLDYGKRFMELATVRG